MFEKLIASDPNPPPYMQGYLSQRSIQAALGVPLNYTEVIESVNQVFAKTGDMNRGGRIHDIGLALDSGIKVAMVYGDRDAVSNRTNRVQRFSQCRHATGAAGRQ